MAKYISQKNILLSLIGSFIIFQSAHAMAQDYYPNGFYVMAGGGYSYLSAKSLDLKPTSSGRSLRNDSASDGVASGTFGLGYKFSSFLPLRIELNYVRRGNLHYKQDPIIPGETTLEYLQSNIENQTGMASLYYDFHFETDYFVPYLGAGAGYSSNRVEMDITPSAGGSTQSVNKTLSNLAWQVALGVRMKLTHNVIFDFGARHASLGKLQWGPWSGDYNWKITSDELASDEGFLEVELFFGDQTPQRAPTLINDDAL